MLVLSTSGKRDEITHRKKSTGQMKCISLSAGMAGNAKAALLKM
jgi:hypothetical protein